MQSTQDNDKDRVTSFQNSSGNKGLVNKSYQAISHTEEHGLFFFTASSNTRTKQGMKQTGRKSENKQEEDGFSPHKLCLSHTTLGHRMLWMLQVYMASTTDWTNSQKKKPTGGTKNKYHLQFRQSESHKLLEAGKGISSTYAILFTKHLLLAAQKGRLLGQQDR